MQMRRHRHWSDFNISACNTGKVMFSTFRALVIEDPPSSIPKASIVSMFTSGESGSGSETGSTSNNYAVNLGTHSDETHSMDSCETRTVSVSGRIDWTRVASIYIGGANFMSPEKRDEEVKYYYQNTVFS
ncbi:hypothetical protein TorRG33x02_255090 [Trema orientale]|uniref:Uncharacterized protein n=1 Tax=Trema orientale TaxID=63057 RepID=A0A2P5DD75_TREOI|nr:hypothetical protein TorRG33x02_255090 [Trema orientale]